MMIISIEQSFILRCSFFFHFIERIVYEIGEEQFIDLPVFHFASFFSFAQSPQRPFSDAYISGMSSKRRKLINNSKPSAAEPNNILPQAVRQVLQTRISHGANTTASSSSTSSASVSTAAASLDEAILTNQHIQEPYGSYEQALLNHVQNRIRTDTDFTPERFPNCSKWISKNK